MPEKLPYSRWVLDNGLTVLVYPMKENRAVSILFRIDAGRIYEPERWGVSHVMEHYISHGTEKFPTVAAVNEQVVKMGMSRNAVTADHVIDTEAHLPNFHLAGGLEMAAQIAFRPIFPQQELENIRSTVVQEWHDRHDQPNFRFGRKLNEKRFKSPNYRYVRDESLPLLEGAGINDIRAFHRKFFKPERTILSVAGGVRPGEVLRLTEQLCGDLKPGPKIAEPEFERDPYAGLTIVTHQEEKAQGSFEISFPAFGWKGVDKDKRVAASLLGRVLGAEWVGRLWRKLRDERGWVYSVWASMEYWPWAGLFGIGGSCNAQRLGEVLKLIRGEIDDLVLHGPRADEVELARDYRLGRMATGFEDSFGVAGYMSGEEWSGEGIELLEQKMARVKRIKKEAVWAVAKEVFDFKRVQVGLMNDFQSISKEKFEEMAGEIF